MKEYGVKVAAEQRQHLAAQDAIRAEKRLVEKLAHAAWEKQHPKPYRDSVLLQLIEKIRSGEILIKK